MKIVIDCRFAAKNVGLGRYTRGIVQELLRIQSDDFYCLLIHPDDSKQWLPNTSNFTLIEVSFTHYSVKEQLVLPYLLRKHKADVFYSPHFNVPVLSFTPTIVTVHDLILHKFSPTRGCKYYLYKFVLYRAISQARMIIAVSKFTMQELQDVYGSIVDKKLTVLTEGIEEQFGQRPKAVVSSVLQKFSIKQPYFLYVGNHKVHKNVPTLLQAWNTARRTNSVLVLVSAGVSKLPDFTSHSMVEIDSCTDEELVCLYNGAECTITASLYEGFCLPIIESRACRTPIIATNSSAIKELKAADTILVEPTIADVSKAITQFVAESLPPQPRPASWSSIALKLHSLLHNG